MNHRRHPELLTAYAQVLITVVFLAGYFWVLGLFVTGRARVSSELKDMVTTLLGVLTASVVAILSYWFARQRGKGEEHAGREVVVERINEPMVAGRESRAAGAGGAGGLAPRSIDGNRVRTDSVGREDGGSTESADRALRGAAAGPASAGSEGS